MLTCPRFKPHYRVEIVDGEGVALLSEKVEDVVFGHIYELVAPLLDGRRSVDDVLAELRGQAFPNEVLSALAVLERRGLLCESADRVPPEEAALWATQDVDPVTARRRLETATVKVNTVGSVSDERFIETLYSYGIRSRGRAELTVVLTDDYLRSDLAAYNFEALKRRRPWMLVKPRGAQIWIGPVFRPETTGCWECLADRLRNHRAVEAFVLKKSGRSGTIDFPPAFTRSSEELAWNLAASRVARWLVRPEGSGIDGQVLSFDFGSGVMEPHSLIRRPQCPACGDRIDPLEAPAPPVVLQSRKKNFTQDGGHRATSPDATFDRYKHHISPITGAIRALQRRGRPKSMVIHAYDASYNIALRHRNLERANQTARHRASGKGSTDLQARVSALCEALERFSGKFTGEEPIRLGRFSELGKRAIHPNACMGFSERQFREREAWNSRKTPFSFVPLPFDEDAEVPWSPVWSLTHEAERLLPLAFCYFGYPFPSGGEYCVACSNGAAAGNSNEEAVLQGLLELVERDAVALWWYNRIQRPAVDLDSFSEPYLEQVRSWLRGRNRELWVLDLTSDLAIPVFAAASRRTDSEREQILFGFGAHLDPRIAILRAVTEMNQFLSFELSETAESRPATMAEGEFGLAQWLQSVKLQQTPYLTPHSTEPAKRASDYPRNWSDDLKEDILFCRSILEQRGLEVLVLDQTRPDIGLPVVKVMVPGLRHFWPRFAPGRLYGVPVKMGWLDKPRTEEQLNPVAMFV